MPRVRTRTIDDNPAVSTIAGIGEPAQKGIEPFLTFGDFRIKGKTLSVCRAELSRAVTLVVAPFLTVAATRALARGIPADELHAEWLQIRVIGSYQVGEKEETIEQPRVDMTDPNRTNAAPSAVSGWRCRSCCAPRPICSRRCTAWSAKASWAAPNPAMSAAMDTNCRTAQRDRAGAGLTARLYKVE
ncbi:hypothetical protein [Bradyrhizobium sp.]|uniref:hypothetical protein n=1 Tax=Bradyrhizobium sp. TaxID=376 RepID=UPI003C41804B